MVTLAPPAVALATPPRARDVAPVDVAPAFADPTLVGVASRWVFALLLAQNALQRRVTATELAAWLADTACSLDAGTLRGIEAAARAPALAEVAALCQVLARRAGVAVDPGWLAFGDATQAPAPALPLVSGHQALRRR